MRSALPEFAPYAQTWRWHTSVGTLRGRYDHLCYNDTGNEGLLIKYLPAGASPAPAALAGAVPVA